MADIKIEGDWSWLDPIMSDPNHPSGLHLQITKLGLLTRIILDGDKFNATIFSGGRAAFLESYTVAAAVALDRRALLSKAIRAGLLVRTQQH